MQLLFFRKKLHGRCGVALWTGNMGIGRYTSKVSFDYGKKISRIRPWAYGRIESTKPVSLYSTALSVWTKDYLSERNKHPERLRRKRIIITCTHKKNTTIVIVRWQTIGKIFLFTLQHDGVVRLDYKLLSIRTIGVALERLRIYNIMNYGPCPTYPRSRCTKHYMKKQKEK